MKYLTFCFLTSSVMGLGLMLFIPTIKAESAYHVKKVIVATKVTNRNPEGIFSPSAYCEKDKNGQAAIPIVNSSQTSQVVLWAKVAATKKGKLRHSWHHQIDNTWKKISEVNLSIRPSPGYRMWSQKTLRPEIHIGEWMVVLAPSTAPEKIICITRFTVQ